MINFQYVKWRNFLSTGNQFTKVELNRSTTTLLVGANGHGKSTIVDAICFALFNKPFRNINKSQLINSINKKELEVEICFKIGTITYRVIRGIKPNTFEIYIDDVLLNQDAATKDYQQYLEENILKLNYKSFTQMSILGAANYTPFMQLPAASRREVIEDLLDISVFSQMNVLLKEKIKNCSELTTVDRRNFELETMKLETQEKYIESIEKNNQDRIQDIEKDISSSLSKIEESKLIIEENEKVLEGIVDPEIEEIEAAIQKKTTKFSKLKSVYKELQTTKNEYTKELLKPIVDAELDSIQKDINSKKTTIDEIKSENQNLTFKRKQKDTDLKFFVENETCPTCTQVIDKDFRNKSKEDAIATISELDKTISLNKAKIDGLASAIDGLTVTYQERKSLLDEERKKDLNQIDSAISDAQNRIDVVDSEINDLNKYLASRNKKLSETKQQYIDIINSHKNIISSETSYIKKLEKEKGDILSKSGNLDEEKNKRNALIESLKVIEQSINERYEEKKYLDVALSILKDNGIKTMIIKQYVPIINKLVNSYLQTQDLFVQFELDETFNEVIRSRHRDDFSYASFSEGEKARIDISILLAFRSIARMKSTSSTDLLLLDETFDSSIDADGSDALSAILSTLEGTHVFVISHNEKMFDKFRSIIKFVKINNYSVIAS